MQPPPSTQVNFIMSVTERLQTDDDVLEARRKVTLAAVSLVSSDEQSLTTREWVCFHSLFESFVTEVVTLEVLLGSRQYLCL
jgi:hypothetical protein